MLLNMLRVEGHEPEDLMKRSYRQFQVERALPELENKLEAQQAQHDAMTISDEEQVRAYQALTQQVVKLKGQLRDIAMSPKNALPFLQPGRLIRIFGPDAQPGDEGVWAAVVNFEKASSRSKGKQEQDGEDVTALAQRSKSKYLVDVLVNCTPESVNATIRQRAVPVTAAVAGSALVVPVSLDEVTALSTLRVYIPQDLRTPEKRTLGVKALSEVERRFASAGVPLLDPEKDMNLKDEEYRKLRKKLNNVEKMLKEHPLAGSSSLPRCLEQLEQKQALHETVKALKSQIKTAMGLVLHEDLKSRKKIMRRLGYVDNNETVTTKGQVASEISTGDELVLADLMLSGVFGELKVEQVAALVSCFVWRERSDVR